ncbi:MAG TPA: adenylate/guanylate cyclase domain-containing protein [Thermoanaerobaculia bacterium]|nr:adenylate/guanylate cyclase domain-containing protein [Thermoanaerobaculia bacterium]
MTRFGAFLGAFCAAIVLASPGFQGAEWLLHDAFTRQLASRSALDPRIIIVSVNEKSVHTLDQAGYGRPPYSREVWAQAIRELQRAGARVIAIDIGLSEENVDHPEGDRELADAVGNAPVVLAADTGPNFPRDRIPPVLWTIRGKPSREIYGIVPPFLSNPPAIGTIRLESSPHMSVVHHYPLADRVKGDAYVASLALEASRVFLGGPRTGAWQRDEFVTSRLHVPVDAKRTFLIRWHSGAHFVDFDKLLTADLMRDEPGADATKLAEFESQFHDKIVLIGYTAQGLFDLRSTPLAPATAGMLIHANAIDNLINGQFNTAVAPPFFAMLTLIIAAIAGGVVHRLHSQWAAGGVAIAGIAIWILAGFVALRGGVALNSVTAASSIALTYITITAVKFTAEQRHTAELRATFGRYVSPQILQHVLAHPESVRLGGERRDLTILFSDIRGFTTISEASEPEVVVEMLNEYLTRMVEILLEHGGTLDKFIGDAVMGFWNAPAADRDHPRHAVECAIAMIEETARIRSRWEAEGKPALRIGIGINTGEAVVGNIGAEKVFGYTVIGDTVNLASRLEGKNKDYGTEIIISEFTLARIDDTFATVYLDEVKVKGKERAVRIYEVKGRTHA